MVEAYIVRKDGWSKIIKADHFTLEKGTITIWQKDKDNVSGYKYEEVSLDDILTIRIGV